MVHGSIRTLIASYANNLFIRTSKPEKYGEKYFLALQTSYFHGNKYLRKGYRGIGEKIKTDSQILSFNLTQRYRRNKR